eukprot:3634731-Prymnesium_polylepis.1
MKRIMSLPIASSITRSLERARVSYSASASYSGIGAARSSHSAASISRPTVVLSWPHSIPTIDSSTAAGRPGTSLAPQVERAPFDTAGCGLATAGACRLRWPRGCSICVASLCSAALCTAVVCSWAAASSARSLSISARASMSCWCCWPTTAPTPALGVGASPISRRIHSNVLLSPSAKPIFADHPRSSRARLVSATRPLSPSVAVASKRGTISFPRSSLASRATSNAARRIVTASPVPNWIGPRPIPRSRTARMAPTASSTWRKSRYCSPEPSTSKSSAG